MNFLSRGSLDFQKNLYLQTVTENDYNKARTWFRASHIDDSLDKITQSPWSQFS